MSPRQVSHTAPSENGMNPSESTTVFLSSNVIVPLTTRLHLLHVTSAFMIMNAFQL